MKTNNFSEIQFKEISNLQEYTGIHMNILDLSVCISSNTTKFTGIHRNTPQYTWIYRKTINSSDIRFRKNFRIYKYIQEYTWIPQICGYAFKEILQNSREYKRILYNAHESTGKHSISQKYSLGKILNLQKYTGIHLNTVDLRGIHLKKYCRIHVNTQEYFTIHMNLQENNEFVRNMV